MLRSSERSALFCRTSPHKPSLSRLHLYRRPTYSIPSALCSPPRLQYLCSKPWVMQDIWAISPHPAKAFGPFSRRCAEPQWGRPRSSFDTSKSRVLHCSCREPFGPYTACKRNMSRSEIMPDVSQLQLSGPVPFVPTKRWPGRTWSCHPSLLNLWV